jgi:hypothetical protein
METDKCNIDLGLALLDRWRPGDTQVWFDTLTQDERDRAWDLWRERNGPWRGGPSTSA